MKSFLVIVMAIGVLAITARAQQDADDSYLTIYGQIQQGDTLAGNGQAQAALSDYQQALASLTTLHNGYPDWNPNIISFRQKYLADRIAALQAQLPAPAPTPAPVTAPVPATPAPGSGPVVSEAPTTVPVASAPSDWADQLATVRRQLQSAQTDNDTLAAKLKEALAAQPAALDPAQLTAAREQIRDLLKQNELLKASLESEKQTEASLPRRQELDKLTRALEKANDKLAAQQKHADKLAAENAANLKKLLASDQARAALQAENELLRGQLTDATNAIPKLQGKLADAQAANVALQASLKAKSALVDDLQAQLHAAQKSGRPVDKLKRELEDALVQNESLRASLKSETEEAEALQKQVKANAKATAKADRPLEKLKRQLADAQAAQKAAEADKQMLQDRIRELQNSPALASTPADVAARIKDLTRERDDLLTQLGDANQKLMKRNVSHDSDAALAQLNADLSAAKAQLAALTLPAVPYTPEELALFVAPTPPVHPPVAKDLPSGTTELAADAQQHFAARQLEVADADYQKILQVDTNNIITLGNLAAIEIEEGHYAQAEAHLRTALAEAPDDGYSLTQLGNVQLHEEKYDDAITTLGRAVQLNAGPEALNFLGVSLSHKGLRPQAEAALRKALELNADFGPAHLNLANVYIDGQPPAPELARWHYQKALAAGQPRSPGLEKELANFGVPVALP